MACYKLSSCTPGAAVVLCSDLPDLIPFIGGTVTLPGLYPGVCFTVEEVLPPCDCCPVLTPLTLEDLGSTCPCTNDTVCYLLTDCNNPAIVYSTLTNLNPYVGQNISVTEYVGCFTVSTQPIETCADTSPVTCIETCVCPPAGYCFDLQNCDDPLAILPITTSFIIAPGQVVSLLPGEIPPAFAEFPNCWTATGDRPCDGSEYVITFVNNEVDCESCLGPTTYCYTLENCEDFTWTVIVQTSSPLVLGNYIKPSPAITRPGETGNCWKVANEVTPCPVPPPYVLTSVTTYTDCAECLAENVCYKLTSCTPGFSSVIYSNLPILSTLSTVEILTYPGICFKVEQVIAPCDCGTIDSFVEADIVGTCICTSPYNCFKLQDCTNQFAPYIYVTGSLDPYVGQNVSVAELPGVCYRVIGVTSLSECESNLPITVTCIENCTCNLYCYEFTNCLNPTEVIQVNSTLALGINHVVAPAPAIIPPGGNNCWTVTGVNIQPCSAVYGITVTAVTDYGTDNCELCAGPPTCYKLTSCDGETIIYTQSDLSAYAGGPSIQSLAYPGQCWFVTVVPEGQTCDRPVVINPLGVSYCTCPCYKLTNCVTGVIIISNSDLGAYVGQNVQLDEYGGCEGDCWEVATNPPPALCTPSVTVTVTLGCVPCPPCGETCYELVDCETDVVFLTVLNPTINGIDLGTLISGQAIGKITSALGDFEGCWYVRLAEDCSSAISVSIFNIYNPTDGTTGCQQCLNSCYAIINCQTFEVVKVIKYTIPNPNGLPNPNTITGFLGNLCFDEPTGCLEGCYYLEVIPGAACEDSVDWTTVVSYTQFPSCAACRPKCYLLTECAPAVSAPIIVSNDFSLYVDSVVKICDEEGVCKCYSVELAQSCTDSIVLNNVNASFSTCEECNSCGCPPGYDLIDGNCQRIITVDAIQNEIIFHVVAGSIDSAYGSLGTRFYNDITFLPYPLITVSGPDRFVDASSTTVPYTSSTTGVWGGPVSSRLNTVGIWTNAAPNPLNEWIGFSQCIQIAESGTYSIGIGGDNYVRIKIDGVLVAETSITFLSFNIWHVFEVTLTAGTHVIVVEGNNSGGAASFGAEIYNASVATLSTFTTSLQLQTVTVFSTFDKIREDAVFETGETSGYSCPPGYTYNNCDTPSCSLIETIPQVECPVSYRVIDCSVPPQPDFITNTDLSAYVGGTYKTCINNPTYSTTCYLLTDCNRLVADIYTNTNLSTYIWESVVLEGYPGSCFIVNGVPAGTACVDAISVTVDSTAEPCICEGAQTPWPDGCYCVTIEEILPPVIGTEFIGVFEETLYECCLDCTRTCYLLTDCNEILDPVVVCNDLAQYVGKVIKIAGCGDICWQVEEADNCDNTDQFLGTITEYEDCETCLPPVPPPPPPYDLHLRKIKPGYNSPNSCYTTNYIEKINCGFAKQVYDAMLVKRYGITVCCEEDLNTWDIKKQLMDLDLLKDPNMCKSTLCDCKPPCLVDVVIELLPYCASPNIISVVTNLPCPAPVIISTSIDYEPTPAPCYCFTLTPVESPTVIQYIDCCCEVQTITTELSTPINVCAITYPVTPVGGAVIESNGFCSDPGPCNPPICYCWKVTNTSTLPPPGEVVNVVFDTCSSILSLYATLNPGQSAYGCSYGVPSVSGTSYLIENTGECGEYCGPTPPVCECYTITLNDGGPAGLCEFNYTNCEGFADNIVLYTGDTVNICSQTLPAPGCPQYIEYSVVPNNNPCQPDGTCPPEPAPCVCYEVILSDVEGLLCKLTYQPCGEAPVTTFYPSGTYYICSEIVPSLGSGSACSITVSSTPDICPVCGPR